MDSLPPLQDDTTDDESIDDTESETSFSMTCDGDAHRHQFLKQKAKPSKHMETATRRRCLPEFVSNWKVKHSNKVNIYYAEKYLATPFDVLTKTGKIKELSELQKQYIHVLKSYLHFDAVHERHADKVVAHRFYGDFMEPLLIKIQDALMDSSPEERKSEEYKEDINNIIRRAKLLAEDFIYELLILLKRTQAGTGLSEGMYSSFFRSFAAMCHLRPRTGDEYASYFEGLMGVNVSSKPDYRLCTRRMICMENYDEFNVVSVVQLIKRDVHVEEGPSTKKRKSSVSCSTDSSISSEVDRRNYISEIEIDLGSAVLGQHAGELLLDLPKWETVAFKDTIKIPGMIVKDTKVFFTLLDISMEHFWRLSSHLPLKKVDVATIFYSKPLDILIEEERNILIENFMRLNNIDLYSEKH